MRKRLITALGLALIGVPAIVFGGIFYYLLMGTFLIGAAWEYVHLFRVVKLEPQMYITVGGVALVTFTRMFFPIYAQPAFAISILVAMAYHRSLVKPWTAESFPWCSSTRGRRRGS